MSYAGIKFIFGFLCLLFITALSGNMNAKVPPQKEELLLRDSIDYYKSQSYMLLELAKLRVDSVIARANNNPKTQTHGRR